MAKAPRISAPPAEVVAPGFIPEYPGDDLTEDEIEQASVGDLISIQGAEFDSVNWSIWRHRTRQEMASEHGGEAREWVADRLGQLHGAELVEQIGGGTFNFRGYVQRPDGRGVCLKYNRTIALAGPRRNFAAVAVTEVTSVGSPPPTSVNGVDSFLARILDRMDARLNAIERGSGDVKPPTLKDLADTLNSLDQMRERGRPEPGNALDNTALLEVLSKGIEIGQGREPGEGGTNWGEIVKATVPALERILANATRRRFVRPAPAGAPGAPAPPASEAEVIVETEPEVNHRWPVAIESLAAAIAERDEPADFAVTLGRILNQQEIGMLRLATPEQVMADIANGAGERFPILKTPAARAFVEGVLAELNSPGEDESPSS